MERILFEWPLNTERLYQTLIRKSLVDIAGMYKGAIFLYLYLESGGKENVDANRQLFHSLREVIDHSLNYKRVTQRAYAEKNKAGDEMRDFYTQHIKGNEEIDSDEFKVLTLSFIAKSREFYRIESEIPRKRKDHIYRTIIELSPRYTYLEKDLHDISRLLYIII